VLAAAFTRTGPRKKNKMKEKKKRKKKSYIINTESCGEMNICRNNVISTESTIMSVTNVTTSCTLTNNNNTNNNINVLSAEVSAPISEN
jgi:hypothetical protein